MEALISVVGTKEKEACDSTPWTRRELQDARPLSAFVADGKRSLPSIGSAFQGATVRNRIGRFFGCIRQRLIRHVE
jgi:hypothetical protein